MTRTRSLLLLLTLLSAACGGDDCPAGQMLIGAACVTIGMDSGPPPPETCNNTDDDMDGVTDEDASEIGEACGTDEGECTTGVYTSCTDGELTCDGVGAAEELCNGLDDDSDGETDEEVLTTFYLDVDGDTFGGEETCMACEASECPDAMGTWVTLAGDCDEECMTCFEGGTEMCDGMDNDCDDETDEGVQMLIYVDEDDDGFGAGEGMLACDVSAGFAIQNGDCADEDERAFPGAVEFYNTPIEGAGVELAYDYDCDGEETLIHDSCFPEETCRNSGCYAGAALECGARNQSRATVEFLGTCGFTNPMRNEVVDVSCR